MSELQQQSFFEWEDANPLLRGIPLSLTFETLGVLLAHDPRLLWKGEIPSLSRLPRLITRIRRLFVVTKIAIEFALQFFEVLIEGLEARDPRIADNRARLFETGRFKGMSLSKLPWFGMSAVGIALEGITGTSKSFTVQRILQLLPQKITHSESEEYGWKKLDQLVYLVVPMPSSARLGAFLLETALRMDAVLGTSYAEALRSKSLSDDKRAVLVLHWLSIHRCGILIIEECQERNLPQHVFGNDFLSLFLRVMNWGIPVLVIGNPKALQTIRTFTQDGRRFGAGHWFTFEPAWDYRSPAWSRDLVPRIWRWSPTQGEDQHIANLELYLWRKTGGITDFLVMLRKEALNIACRAGRDFVMQSDIEAAYEGRAMSVNHQLIQALVTFDAGRLESLTDIPSETIIARWKQLGFLQQQVDGKGPSKADLAAQSDDESPATAPAPAPAPAPAASRASRKPRANPIAQASPNTEGPAPASAPNAPGEEAPDAGPGPVRSHHAPDQHVDRRSAAFQQLLVKPPRRPS
jgi:hypothetical protein